MIRAVVHRTPPPEAAPEALAGAPDAIAPDSFADKLVKYIPAEAIAFYTPTYAYVRSNVVDAAGAVQRGPLLFVLVTTILGLLGYIYARGRSDHQLRFKITDWYFYPLAVVAFMCWAVGTSTVAQDLAGLPGWWDKVILLLGVFLVPLADELLSASPIAAAGAQAGIASGKGS